MRSTSKNSLSQNSVSQNSISWIAHQLTCHPKTMVVGFGIMVIVLGWFVQNFKIDASADTLLLKNNRLYIETQVMHQRFSPQEFILAAYRPKNSPVFSDATFKNINDLSRAFKRLDRVDSVTSILNVPLISQMDSLDPNLSPADWTWERRQYSPREMEQVFDRHPLYTDLLVNTAQTATAIQILFKADPELRGIQEQIIELQKKVLTDELTEPDQRKIDALKKQAAPIEERLTRIRQQEIGELYQIIEPYAKDADIYLGGTYVLGHQLIQIIRSDLILFGSAIGAAICLLLLILFRQWRWMIIPVICCAVSVGMTMGLFGLLDMRTTVISSNFIALQLILTLAIVIHLIVQYRQLSMDDTQASQTRLIEKTLVKKISPCFFAGITTSVGFGALVFSRIQPVVAFGWMMIIAMTVSISVSLGLFPALAGLFKRRDKPSSSVLAVKVIRFFTGLALTHKRFIFIFSLGVFAVSVGGILRLEVENSFLNYFKPTTRVRQELTYIDREFGGSTPLDVIYTIPERQRDPELTLTAEAVQTLQKIQQVLTRDAVGNITSVVNFTELAKRINDNAPLTEYELTVIYRLVDHSLREKLIGAYYSPEHHQLRISTRIQDSTKNLDRGKLLESLNNEIEGIGIAKENFLLCNLFVLYQDILQRLFNSQIMTLGIVFGVLTLVLFVIFRSIKIACIAIVPNILTSLAVLGLMGWMNIPLDLMTITIAAIAMGIAVDDTIHFVHRYLEECENTGSAEAVRRTFNSVGYALLYTSLVITFGFSLLAFSDFVPSVYFGLLTGMAMLTALITDLTLLPAMLVRFVGNKE